MESLLSFGYEDQRFENDVDDDFHCAICMNVLKEPVMCQNNQHYFCTACITRHLVQSEMCPTCREELSVETLRKPPRILTNFLSNLNIRCENYDRGCLGFVKLGDIEKHAVNCGFAPVKCSNDGCSIEVNKRDRIYHETEVCEFRKTKCHDCAELKRDFVEVKKYCVEVKKDCTNLKNDCAEIKRNYAEMKQKVEEVKHSVKEIKDNQKQMMKELMSLAGMIQRADATCASLAPGPSTCVKEDIVIAGGRASLYYDISPHSSVEMFSWLKKTWVRLKSMNKERGSPVSFVHGNTMIVAGGNKRDDGMEQMVFNDDQEKQNWLCFPAKLPKNLRECRCVHFEHRLIVVGGYIQYLHSDAIYEVLLHPPYTVKLLTRFPQARSDHGAERFNEDILIIGGYTSDGPCGSVVLYDVNRNVCKQMPPLPYPVRGMATVTYGEFAVLVGGIGSDYAVLNTVSMYNMRNGRSKMLPSMKHKRARCTAVVTGNTIVVMGGQNDQGFTLDAVECYSFDTNAWEELSPMNECRCEATAVVKTVN